MGERAENKRRMQDDVSRKSRPMLLFGQLVKERQGRGLGDGACARSYV
jgi:hypothetical protein